MSLAIRNGITLGCLSKIGFVSKEYRITPIDGSEKSVTVMEIPFGNPKASSDKKVSGYFVYNNGVWQHKLICGYIVTVTRLSIKSVESLYNVLDAFNVKYNKI